MKPARSPTHSTLFSHDRSDVALFNTRSCIMHLLTEDCVDRLLGFVKHRYQFAKHQSDGGRGHSTESAKVPAIVHTKEAERELDVVRFV
jgi:hypothetical protein